MRSHPEVFDGVRLKKGDFVAVMGPSGSGKTTLLKLTDTVSLTNEQLARVDGITTNVSAMTTCRTFSATVRPATRSFQEVARCASVVLRSAARARSTESSKAWTSFALVSVAGGLYPPPPGGTQVYALARG